MIFTPLIAYSLTCSCLLIAFILIYSASAAYIVNKERKSDDPEKKDFHPLSPWLAPAAPFIWLVEFIFLAPWSILFGIFLIFFPFMLIFLRPLPENDPIKRFILKLGNGILKMNNKLLRALGIRSQPPIKLIPFE
jgi:hypothetical protein